MNFIYSKEINIEIGQTLYGIIAFSTRTYDGVYPIVVDWIDWNNEEIVFKIDQPCQYVSASFYKMQRYVFESEEKANIASDTIEFGEGLYEYNPY
jgi:hypothetical protein